LSLLFEICRTLEHGEEVRRMEKQCCNVRVSELEDGFRIEVTGQDVKTRCASMIEKCCTGENMKTCSQIFGGSGKDKGCCS
jgi:hypothetical protein